MSEWKEVRLGDLCTSQNGYAFKSSSFCSQGEINVIKIKELKNGLVDFSEDTAKVEKQQELYKFIVNKGDIIFALTGDPITKPNPGSWVGRVSLYNHQEPAYLNQRVGRIICGADIDNLYLYYYFRWFPNFKTLASKAKGSASQANISLNDILETAIKLPSLIEQRRISSILSSLDDKIAVNKKICENLEAQAQALFKHWFVDFAPFKDGKFLESELGLIPEGLVYKKIEDMPHILETGKRPAGGVKGIDSGIPSIGAENIKGLGCYDFSKTKYVTEEYASTMKKGIINGYELLIYKDGGKPGYFIPNFAIFGEGYPYDKMCLNEHVFKLDFSNKGYSLFAYFFFKTKQIMSYLNAQGAKAAIPGINSKDIDAIMMPSLENECVKNYCNEVEDIITQILVLSKESSRLATFRDTLLPKLMSGQIKLNEYE